MNSESSPDHLMRNVWDQVEISFKRGDMWDYGDLFLRRSMICNYNFYQNKDFFILQAKLFAFMSMDCFHMKLFQTDMGVLGKPCNASRKKKEWKKEKGSERRKGVVWWRERDRRAAAESEQKTSERVKQLWEASEWRNSAMCKTTPVSVCGSGTARVGVFQEGGGYVQSFLPWGSHSSWTLIELKSHLFCGAGATGWIGWRFSCSDRTSPARSLPPSVLLRVAPLSIHEPTKKHMHTKDLSPTPG